MIVYPVNAKVLEIEKMKSWMYYVSRQKLSIWFYHDIHASSSPMKPWLSPLSAVSNKKGIQYNIVSKNTKQANLCFYSNQIIIFRYIKSYLSSQHKHRATQKSTSNCIFVCFFQNSPPTTPFAFSNPLSLFWHLQDV